MSQVRTLAINDCQALAPVGNLAAYIDWTQRIPVLSKEEEEVLLDQLFNQGDVSAAKKLILSHLRFVVFVSRGFLGYGLSHEDLIQEGNVGLMKAIKRFDPTMGVRLVSFAVHWIKSEIQEFVLKNWRIVKIATTKAARKLFFKKHQMKSKMTRDEIVHLSETLNVSTKDVEDMMAKLSVANDVSYDPMDANEASASAPAQYLATPGVSCLETAYIDQTAEMANRVRLQQAMKQLDERAADIIQKRWLSDDESKHTLHDLASEYSISAERVRQLEKAAMTKLKKHLGQLDFC